MRARRILRTILASRILSFFLSKTSSNSLTKYPARTSYGGMPGICGPRLTSQGMLRMRRGGGRWRGAGRSRWCGSQPSPTAPSSKPSSLKASARWKCPLLNKTSRPRSKTVVRPRWTRRRARTFWIIWGRSCRCRRWGRWWSRWRGSWWRWARRGIRRITSCLCIGYTSPTTPTCQISTRTGRAYEKPRIRRSRRTNPVSRGPRTRYSTGSWGRRSCRASWRGTSSSWMMRRRRRSRFYARWILTTCRQGLTAVRQTQFMIATQTRKKQRRGCRGSPSI